MTDSDHISGSAEQRLTKLEAVVEGGRSARDGMSVFGMALAAIALFVATVGVGFGMRAIDEADGGGDVAAGGTETFEIEVGEMYVEPSSITVPAGTEVIVVVTNVGTMDHDLKTDGTTGTDMIPPGETVEASLGVMTGTTQAWCTVPGHKESGMILDIEVTGESSGGHDAHAAASTGGEGTSGAEIDFAATPEPDWEPYDPELQPAPGATEHELTLRATEVEMEVAPGVTQEMWTFNDMFPGPVLRGKVGDLFTVTLVNEGKVGHSLDFHASRVAWDDEMRTIGTGESLVYQFVAEYSGVWMYHCGTSPALHHIGNGMFGAIVIDPPDLPEVDHEFIFVQSEIYTGPMGEPGDLGKMQDEAWDAVVFNGYVNQYQHAPIRVEPDERVRAYVLDAGPSENSAFHIVGTIFDTVYKEGQYLVQPGNPQQGASQALDLQPAQGGFVEFSFAEAGFYPIVTHKFANVGKGAMGFFQAGEAEMPEGGH